MRKLGTRLLLSGAALTIALSSFQKSNSFIAKASEHLLDAKKDTTDILRIVPNKAFKRGEKLTYKVNYGLIEAGEAVLTITEDQHKIGERGTFHAVATGKTEGMTDWIFPVNDRYESYIDDQAILPWVFIRDVSEGDYKFNRSIVFDHYKNKAIVEKKKYNTDTNAQDLISTFYYARTLDFANAKENDVFKIPTFFDYENYPMQIKYLGIENVETDLGEFKCYKFRPMLEKGRVFEDEEDMTVWISADEAKVPIRVETEILVGSIKMDLYSYSGLTTTLNEIED